MKPHVLFRLAAVLAGVGITAGCAGSDNPTALADLDPDVEFEVEATEIQTFEEVEFHVHISEAGAPLPMQHSELEIRHAASGATRTLDMEPTADGYAVHVTFFQPGEHHVHFVGMPEHHGLSAEFGETEVDVVRRHQLIGSYWVELEVAPVPQEGVEGHVHVLVYDGTGGAKGAPVGGLDLALEIHAPDGTESALTVLEEEPGEYEAEYTFGEAGEYELHVEIDAGGSPVEGEFHIPLFSTEPDQDDGQGGGGHDHG